MNIIRSVFSTAGSFGKGNPTIAMAWCAHSVAAYCAIPRDYLSDTPLLCAMFFFLVSQHGQLGAIPLPPFLSVSLESMQSGGAIPQKGYLSDTCAIPLKTRQRGCDTPLCATISKRYCAIWRGISHWAPKAQKYVREEFPRFLLLSYFGAT